MEIKTVLFLVDHIKEEYLADSSIASTKEYRELAVLMNDEAGFSVSESTFKRFLSFKEIPYPISYRSLDLIVKWCFPKDSWNFKDFIQKKEVEINNRVILNEEDLKTICDQVTEKQSLVSKRKNLVIGDFPITFTLGEGVIEKLIQDVSIIVGDLFKNQGKKDLIEISSFNKQSINDRLALKENRRQSNIDSIIVKAISFAREKEASDKPIDPDWIVEFFNVAQDCSDENMQYLWAKLLADEITEPNSFSRRALTTIKMLNSSEALVFSKLCCCIWDLEESHFGREKMLLKDMDANGRYSDETWGFNGSFISHLEQVGLVYDSFLQLDEKRIYNASFFGKSFKLKAHQKEQQIDLVALTQVGQEIFRIVRPEPNQEYFDHTLEYFQKINILYD